MHIFFLFAFVVASFADVEDPDVVVLTDANFNEVIEKNDYVLVEFYAPWCGHCKNLAPEYAKAATALKKAGGAVLAKVDATVESALAERFGIRGYPTLKFFRNGESSEYEGGRTEAEIINWVTKKSGPPSKVLASQADIDTFLASPGTRVIAYLTSDNEAAWNKVGSNEKTKTFAFAHVTDSSLFNGKNAGTVELHKEGEEALTYTGDFNTESLVNWASTEGFPLVDDLSQESWTRAQTSSSDLLAVFQKERDNSLVLEIAKAKKGSLIVTTSEQVGIATRWGSSGNVVPTAIYVHQGASPQFTVWNEDAGVELNAETLSAFVDAAIAGTYESYIKSEPIPEDNNGPVTVLVGKNFEEIVKQKGKDVLVEFYAPWCGHCKKLAPVYDELGEAFKDDANIIIAKMDATANGNPKGVSIAGFPTIILFNAENVQVEFDQNRDLEGFKKFIELYRYSEPSVAEKSEL